MVEAIGLACLAVVGSSRPVAGQTPTLSEPNQVVWTAIGSGIGFGGGVLAGLALFDDAIDSGRKVWTTAVVSAVAGGLAGNLLSRIGDSSAPRPTDSLWNGMAIGAAAGGVIGMWYVPARNCKPDINPECPAILRLIVGIPAIAGGAALGALVDRFVRGRPASPTPHSSGSRGLLVPVVGPGTVGFVYSRSFE